MPKEGEGFAKPPWSRKEDGVAFDLDGATLRCGYTFSCLPATLALPPYLMRWSGLV